MTNKKTRPNNRNRSDAVRQLQPTTGVQDRRKLLAFIIAAVFIVYLSLFLQQPSLFGVRTQDGEVVNRYVDLLLMPTEASAVLSQFSLLGILDRIVPLGLAASWMAVCMLIGRPWTDASGLNLSRLERMVLATLAGLAIMSTAVLLIGLGGGLHSRVPLLLCIVTLASGSLLWLRRSGVGLTGLVLSMPGQLAGTPHANSSPSDKERGNDQRETSHRDSTLVEATSPGNVATTWLIRLTPVLTVVLALAYLLGSLLPPWEFDVVVYHLLAPKEFYQAGQITLIPHNVYANMPLGVEMHSLALMTLLGTKSAWWLGGLAGKTITGSFSLMAAALLGSFAARRWGHWYGWAAAGLLLATPGNVHVAFAGLIDIALASYILAALVALHALHRGSETLTANFATLFLIAVLAGAAAACKYPGLIVGTLPILALLAWNIRGDRSTGLPGVAIAITLAMLLTCGAWYAKNLYFTGNPVYPLAYDLFGGFGLDAERAARWSRAHQPQPVAGGGAYSLAALTDALTRLTIGSPLINPCVVFLGFGGVLAVATGRGWTSRQNGTWSASPWRYQWIGVAAWIFLVWWFVTHRIDRFWLPALPIIVAFAVFGTVAIAKGISRTLAALLALSGIGWGTLACLSGACVNDTEFFVPLETLRKASQQVGESVLISPATGWANSTLTPDDKVLLVGEARAYHFEIPVVYASCFNVNSGERWLRDLTPDRQLENLQTQGVTHMIVDWDEIARYRDDQNYGFSDWPQREDIEEMVANGVLEKLSTQLNPDSITILKRRN